MDDEQLLNLLLRTTTLVRREERPRGGHHGEPVPPGPPHGPRNPYDRPGPPPGPGGMPGEMGYAPMGPGRDGRPDDGRPDDGRRGRGPHLAQGRVLTMLNVKEGQSQKDLAYLLGIRPQSLTATLAELEDEGMIERRKNPDDGRVINVFLTDAGRERAEQAMSSRKERAQGTFAALDDDDKDELARILTKLSDALED